jgi:Fe-S-cluster containining protein
MRSNEALTALHARIDREAAAIATTHSARLNCRRGCSECCQDELTVYTIEAQRIVAEFGDLLATATPHAEGACAFLGRSGACRVYSARPYVCRTQGLPLRYLAEDEEGEIVEVRDICPLNLDGPALELLDEQDCWTLGVVEEDLARLQFEVFGDYERVELRSLFSTRR